MNQTRKKPRRKSPSVQEIPWDIQQAGDDVVLFYLYLLQEKQQSPAWAAMLALRQPPRVMTDDVALSGAPTIGEMYAKDPETTARLCQAAMKLGYKPKGSDFYNSAVASQMGDPLAFMNHGQGRGHVRKVLESRGYNVSRGGAETQSMFNVEAREPDADLHEQPKHKLNPRIVERIRKRKLKENPDLARKDQREVRAEIVSQHGS